LPESTYYSWELKVDSLKSVESCSRKTVDSWKYNPCDTRDTWLYKVHSPKATSTNCLQLQSPILIKYTIYKFSNSLILDRNPQIIEPNVIKVGSMTDLC
jgi:hypothetical protein